MLSVSEYLTHAPRMVKRTTLISKSTTNVKDRMYTTEANGSRKLIVGLGNPGSKFEGTRHNIGFNLIDVLAEEHGISMKKSKFNSFYGTGAIGNQSVILVKPQTFMNLSGSAVRSWADLYKVDFRNCIIIHDAADLPLGSLKLKIGGSSGGQNGVKSIIEKLGSKDFPRLKLGIGAPGKDSHMNLADYVLSKFPTSDSPKVDELILKGKSCLQTWLNEGAEKAMNDFNGENPSKPKKPKRKESNPSNTEHTESGKNETQPTDSTSSTHNIS